MQLKDHLRNEMADAMRSGERERRDVLRLLVAAIKQEEVDSGQPLDDEGVLTVLRRQAKQRRETINDAYAAGRQDLVAQEEAELRLIESYLPQMMSREEIRELAAQAIAELNVSDLKSMGRVMGQLMPRLQGKAEGHVVSDVVRELLSGRA
ncbi:MAG: GatB/YqeY domain-containing protein [Anaerolineae bacterium]|nr:GatB/YqeY domain-containing protein [Anaerolineae bacterium]